MLSTLRNAWKIPELRKRLIFTVIMIVIFRLGNAIIVPNVDATKIATIAKNGSLLNFYDMISGGAFSRYSIFAGGVIPYINASIIMQLLTIAIPRLEQLSKEGEDGRKKIQKYTRYASVPLAVLQGFTQYAIIANVGALKDNSKFSIFLIIMTVTVGSTFLMWLGDKITEHGIGNGISLLIFVNIISRLPTMFKSIYTQGASGSANIVQVVTFMVIYVALFVAVVISTLAERRITVQYAGKTVGNKTYRGQSTHIPINVNNSGVIAIIFAMSVLLFPSTVLQFWPTSNLYKVVVNGAYSPFKNNSYAYAIAYFLLIIFFTWFYTQVTFKPDEMAENMNKSSGFIPGVRPGEPTANYIEKVLDKISLIGGTFAGLVAVIPILFGLLVPAIGQIQFGGTTLLIEVGVALETMRQLESQMVMRHYQGFLK